MNKKNANQDGPMSILQAIFHKPPLSANINVLSDKKDVPSLM